jgi:hypothetical protein
VYVTNLSSIHYYFVILRLVYNFEVFAKNVCDNSSGCTCLGYLGQCNTNRTEASLAAASRVTKFVTITVIELPALGATKFVALCYYFSNI